MLHSHWCHINKKTLLNHKHLIMVCLNALIALMLIRCSRPTDDSNTSHRDTQTISNGNLSSNTPAPKAVSPSSRPQETTDGQSGATYQTASPNPSAPKGNVPVAPTDLIKIQKRSIRSEKNKPVYMVESVDPTQGAFQLMERLAPNLSPDLKVLIKPNLGGFTWFSNGPDNGMIGRTTDPAFVEGILKYLHQNGVRHVTIAESWGVDKPEDVQKLFRVSGMKKLSTRYPGTRTVDLNYYGGKGPNDKETIPLVVDLPEQSPLADKLVLPKLYVDHLLTGLVIDVPILKTHRFAVVTAGIKNLMGVVGIKGTQAAHKNKWRMHEELSSHLKKYKTLDTDEGKNSFVEVQRAFSKRLIDAYTAAHPHITLIDGTMAAQGDGFDKGFSVPASMAIGSYNTVFADVIAAKAIGLWQNKLLQKSTGIAYPHYLQEALERFYGGLTVVDQIQVRGDVHLLERPLKLTLHPMGGVSISGNGKSLFAGNEPLPVYYLGDRVSNMKSALEKWHFENGPWIMTLWNGAPLPFGVSTSIGMAYTDNALFVFFHNRVRDFNPRPLASTGDKEIGDLYKWDVVELFVDPAPSSPDTYYEYELSPANEHLDLSIDLANGKFDATYDSMMDGFSMVDPSRRLWTAVMRIPFETGKLPRPNPGDIWSANLFRVEGKEKNRLFMAWKPTNTKKPQFHVPSAFGKIQFEAPQVD